VRAEKPAESLVWKSTVPGCVVSLRAHVYRGRGRGAADKERFTGRVRWGQRGRIKNWPDACSQLVRGRAAPSRRSDDGGDFELEGSGLGHGRSSVMSCRRQALCLCALHEPPTRSVPPQRRVPKPRRYKSAVHFRARCCQWHTHALPPHTGGGGERAGEMGMVYVTGEVG